MNGSDCAFIQDKSSGLGGSCRCKAWARCLSSALSIPITLLPVAAEPLHTKRKREKNTVHQNTFDTWGILQLKHNRKYSTKPKQIITRKFTSGQACPTANHRLRTHTRERDLKTEFGLFLLIICNPWSHICELGQPTISTRQFQYHKVKKNKVRWRCFEHGKLLSMKWNPNLLSETMYGHQQKGEARTRRSGLAWTGQGKYRYRMSKQNKWWRTKKNKQKQGWKI